MILGKLVSPTPLPYNRLFTFRLECFFLDEVKTNVYSLSFKWLFVWDWNHRTWSVRLKYRVYERAPVSCINDVTLLLNTYANRADSRHMGLHK